MYTLFKTYKAELKLIQSIRHFNSGDVRKSIKLSKESLKISSGNVDALMLLGNIYGSINDYSNAYKYFKLACDLDNPNIMTYISASDCLLNLDKNQEALMLIDEALKYYKNDINLLFSKANILETMEEYDKELACADYILNLGKYEIEALFIKAHVYDLKKMYDFLLNVMRGLLS